MWVFEVSVVRGEQSTVRKAALNVYKLMCTKKLLETVKKSNI